MPSRALTTLDARVLPDGGRGQVMIYIHVLLLRNVEVGQAAYMG